MKIWDSVYIYIEKLFTWSLNKVLTELSRYIHLIKVGEKKEFVNWETETISKGAF